jgi:hypothetical protein
MRDEGWRGIDHQWEELPPVVPDDWGSVMTTGKYLPWVPADELLVESLGLAKAYDTFQSYSQLQMFLLAFPTLLSLTAAWGKIDNGRGHGELGRDHLTGVLL